MEGVSLNFGTSFSSLVSFFLVGFYLLFALLYIVYSIVYLHVVKVLNNTVKTQYYWLFDFLAALQLLLSMGIVLLGLNFVF